MKIVDKLLKEQKFQFPHPMDIIADLAFKAGYQASIDQLKNCRTLVKTPTGYNIESNVDSSVIDYLEREVEDE